MTDKAKADEKLVKFLRNTSWFKELPEDVAENLAKKIKPHKIEKDEALMKKGDKGDSVFIIRTGRVKVVISDEGGGEVVLNHLGPSEFVGELSLIDQKPRSATVVALSPVDALELKRKDFLELLEKYPILSLYVIINISSRMRFSLTYVEKAIQWSYKIAEGDYSFAQEEIQKTQNTFIIDNSRPDDARANRFLTAFFKMVEGVQKREEVLKKQVYELSIKIDPSVRDQEIDSVVSSEFFQKLKDESTEVRKTRPRKEQ
jgi:CRP-like cAMP-binding protein